MRHLLLIPFVIGVLGSPALGQQDGDAKKSKTLRIGIIGLDTSHAPAFTKMFNQEPPDPEMQNCRVVAAYPFGSREIESSSSRIPKFTAEVKALGVEVVDSIDALLQKVDCVLLETNDGRPHLEQALQVFRAGKPVFIDKPLGSKLSEVVAIVKAAEHFGVPMFSSSSLRYSTTAQEIRAGKIGDVLGCDAFSPAALEKTHVDLYWYGIHGVEILFTCMGTGCQSVSHTSTKDTELAVGVWDDGRIGTFRGTRSGKQRYGGTAFGTKGVSPAGTYDGYQPLVRQIAEFFRTKKVPIEAAETTEIYAFMQAAYESKQNNGAVVSIQSVMESATAEAEILLQGKL